MKHRATLEWPVRAVLDRYVAGRNVAICTEVIATLPLIGDGRGDPIDKRYAMRRQLNEPLTEMVQTKGASETHPLLSPNDEFAGFETQFKNLISTSTPSKVKYGYIRQAWTDGLVFKQKLGVNPFKFGAASGADVHSGYSGNEEFGWNGAHGTQEDTPKKRLALKPTSSGEYGFNVSSAGTTAVWAEENTRPLSLN